MSETREPQAASTYEGTTLAPTIDEHLRNEQTDSPPGQAKALATFSRRRNRRVPSFSRQRTVNQAREPLTRSEIEDRGRDGFPSGPFERGGGERESPAGSAFLAREQRSDDAPYDARATVYDCSQKITSTLCEIDPQSRRASHCPSRDWRECRQTHRASVREHSGRSNSCRDSGSTGCAERVERSVPSHLHNRASINACVQKRSARARARPIKYSYIIFTLETCSENMANKMAFETIVSLVFFRFGEKPWQTNL